MAATVVYVASFGLVAFLLPMVEDPAAQGVLGLAVSGLMGLLACGVAVLIRIRGVAAFGFRRPRVIQMIVGVVLGVVAYVVGSWAAIGYIVISGDNQQIQGSYQAAAAGGALTLTLSIVFGAILTPLGEEAAFRGVLTNALLNKWPAWLALVVSSLIFAVAHGINPVMINAFVVGLFAGILFRWSRSVWPGVAVHAFNNLSALVTPLIVVAAGLA